MATVPLLGVMVPLGLLAPLSGLVVPAMGKLLAIPLAWIATLLLHIMAFFAGLIHWNYPIPGPPLSLTICFLRRRHNSYHSATSAVPLAHAISDRRQRHDPRRRRDHRHLPVPCAMASWPNGTHRPGRRPRRFAVPGLPRRQNAERSSSAAAGPSLASRVAPNTPPSTPAKKPSPPTSGRAATSTSTSSPSRTDTRTI